MFALGHGVYNVVKTETLTQINSGENQIVIYQPNETVRLDVRLENETVWLNRHQMAQRFGRDVKTIGKHIANALSEELACSSVVADFATTQRQQNPTSAKFAQVELITICDKLEGLVLKRASDVKEAA